MAVSLESRVPLLDFRIVELAARIPPALKLAGGEMKHILRQACVGIVPERIVGRRDKMGFPVPLQQWARGPAREFFSDVLLSRACRERGLFDPAGVERLMHTEGNFGRSLWGLLQLELWHQTFIDRRIG
jgi:asparagine synthase (glutamine-hydrolysing)